MANRIITASACKPCAPCCKITANHLMCGDGRAPHFPHVHEPRVVRCQVALQLLGGLHRLQAWQGCETCCTSQVQTGAYFCFVMPPTQAQQSRIQSHAVQFCANAEQILWRLCNCCRPGHIVALRSSTLEAQSVPQITLRYALHAVRTLIDRRPHRRHALREAPVGAHDLDAQRLAPQRLPLGQQLRRPRQRAPKLRAQRPLLVLRHVHGALQRTHRT